MDTQVKRKMDAEVTMGEQPKTSSKSADLGTAIAFELMIFSLGFLFGLGFTLADKSVDSLYYGGE